MTGNEAGWCGNGQDDDSDGLVDCQDPDCSGDIFCSCTSDADCDDDNACTVGTCLTGNSTCNFAPLECADDDPCTADACDPLSGCASEPIDGCPIELPYQTAFECGDVTWTMAIEAGDVGWGIDGLPNPPGYSSPGCSLNFNDDTHSYGTIGGASTATATSMLVDATGVSGVYLAYVDYWETGDGPGSDFANFDLRAVRISSDEFQTVTSLDPGHTAQNEARWNYNVLDLSAFAGSVFQVQFWFDTVDDFVNDGAGWFIDDLVLSETPPEPPQESCADGQDNDFDGIVDCADPSCDGDAACPEGDHCADARDNDLDGAVDCADDDCAGDPGCPEVAHCTDAVDNDLDGLTDCADDDCADDPDCGCQVDSDCGDGDPCTDDVCDSATTQCSHPAAVCEDGDPCTIGACDPFQGCLFQVDPAACDDGDLCTVDACDSLAGCTNEAVDGCPSELPYVTAFDCDTSDWQTQIQAGTVGWAVDALPDPPAFFSGECSLNFNNDVGDFISTDEAGISAATATSLVIDATGAADLYLSYRDLWDTGDLPDTSYDLREVRVSTDGFSTFTSLPSGHAGTPSNQWAARSHDLSAYAGELVQVQFWFDSVDAIANTGVGWFVDDLAVTTGELCDDGLDNDANGLVDCDDPGCAGIVPCICETDGECDDGDACTVDSCNLETSGCEHVVVGCDDAVDCTADSCDPTAGCVNAPDHGACSDGLPCTTDVCDSGSGCVNLAVEGCPLELPYSTAFECGDPGWSSVILEGIIGWAIDGLPDPPAFVSGDCSLNFNDDVDSYSSGAGVPSSATTTSLPVDASEATTIWLSYMDYWDTEEGPGTATPGFDLAEVRVSTDDFETFTSFEVGHTVADKAMWAARAIDLSAFAGSIFQVQFWFDSVDSVANAGAGWFIDDLSISAGEVCGDGFDNDGDGLVDCVDDDCASDPICACATDGDCDDGDPCTIGTCDLGVGLCAFEAVDCDDGVDCTVDSCTPGSGCTATPDHAACADGDLCTADTCGAQGCGHEDIAGCVVEALPFDDPFDCGESAWAIDAFTGDVGWAVDGLPDPPAYQSESCSLNFNDDVAGYGSSDDGAAGGSATSPVLDATGAAAVSLEFANYWETGDGPDSGFDQREVRVSADGFATFTSFDVGHTAENQATWTTVVLDLSAFAGGQLQIQFWFDTGDGFANEGAGWFIDDVSVTIAVE